MRKLAITALTICAIAGQLRVNHRKLLVLLVGTALIGGSMIVGTRAVLATASDDAAQQQQILRGMKLMSSRAPETVMTEPSPNPVPLKPDQSRLDRIRRGQVRCRGAGLRPSP